MDRTWTGASTICHVPPSYLFSGLLVEERSCSQDNSAIGRDLNRIGKSEHAMLPSTLKSRKKYIVT